MHQIQNKQLRRLLEADAENDPDEPNRVPTVHDLDNSEYNPANDAFIGMVKSLQQLMTEYSRKLRPSHLAVAKLAETGTKTAHIAAQVRINQSTVRAVLKRPDVQAMREVMQQYTALLQGSTQQQRDNMLYRIAVRNELVDPKISLSALSEMNKTEHNERVHQLAKKQGGTSNQTVIVQLNDPRLQPSKLDEAPAHLIKDIN